jgi:hypothetical protein
MKTRELKPNEWKNFCRYLNESQHGCMITLKMAQPDGTADPVVTEVPLQSFNLKENPDSCNDEILIEAGLPNERPRQHTIIEPVRLILRNGHGDRFNELDVIAENGTTVMTFHPGINPTALGNLGA